MLKSIKFLLTFVVDIAWKVHTNHIKRAICRPSHVSRPSDMLNCPEQVSTVEETFDYESLLVSKDEYYCILLVFMHIRETQTGCEFRLVQLLRGG